jgi:hypothetical protein
MQIKIQFQLEQSDITNAYRGRLGCACGCAGVYADEPGRRMMGIVKKINNNITDVEIYKGTGTEVIFELVYDISKVVRAYVDTANLDELIAKELMAVAQ